MTDPTTPGDQLAAIIEHPERFDVPGTEGVAWCMRRLAEATERIAHATALRDLEVERLDGWLHDRIAGDVRMATAMEAMLTRHLEDARAASGGRTKSVMTPYGRVSSTKIPARWVITDEDAFLAAVGDDPQLVRITRHPVKAALAERLAAVDEPGIPTATGPTVRHVVVDRQTGTVLPGVAWQPEGLSVKVTPDLSMAPAPETISDDPPVGIYPAGGLPPLEPKGARSESCVIDENGNCTRWSHDHSGDLIVRGDDPAGGALDRIAGHIDGAADAVEAFGERVKQEDAEQSKAARRARARSAAAAAAYDDEPGRKS